jgi:hypothetical protein
MLAGPDRGDLPWEREWVRKFLTKPKEELRWNAARTPFGRLPEFWYDLADEIGWLLQDEWPMSKSEWTLPELTRQYKQWMQESWNHPSIVIWDCGNETLDARTAEVIENVRGLDLSNRPWENCGYGKRTMAGDLKEAHPYTYVPWCGEIQGNDPIWDVAVYSLKLALRDLATMIIRGHGCWATEGRCGGGADQT